MLYPPNLIMWLDVICRKYHTIHYKSKGGSPALLLSSSSFMLSQIVISLAPGTRHISHFFLRNAGNNISREQKYGVTMSYTEWGGSQNTYKIKKYKSLHFSLDLDISWNKSAYLFTEIMFLERPPQTSNRSLGAGCWPFSLIANLYHLELCFRRLRHACYNTKTY